MVEEIDESGFYREDFSTESDWEVFNAQLGELFQKWELHNAKWEYNIQHKELLNCQWTEQHQTLEVLKRKIIISYYSTHLNDAENINTKSSVKECSNSTYHRDLISICNEHCSPMDERINESHPLAYFYGLNRFIVIYPEQSDIHFFANMAEFSFFLSSANVVAADVSTVVPIFIQIFNPKWNYFVGTSISQSLRTSYDVITLDKTPKEYCHLSGLSKIFKEKLPKNIILQTSVSVKITYELEPIQIRIAMHIPPFAHAAGISSDEESYLNTNIIKTCNFVALPYGYFPDSITEQHIICTWPEIAENIVIDSPFHSDFIDSNATKKKLFLNTRATSYLSCCLKDYFKLSNANQKLDSITGRNFSISTADIEKSSSSKSMETLRVNSQKIPGPINENELRQMILYLFPEHLFPYSNIERIENTHMRIKTGYPDCLVFRLSCLLSTCNSHFGGIGGMTQLWVSFIRQLRYLWDNYIDVPGIAPGFPDTRTCLLHQKLQMLNICIERRRTRDIPYSSIEPKSTYNSKHSEIEDDDDEEFYDCVNDDTENTITTEFPIYSNKPEGRLKRLGDQKLITSNEFLYVPIIQEPVPKTEDQLKNDTEMLLKLEHDIDLKAKLMCPSLLSDMEAFKAANPEGNIEDFIRWYSPRDWEETTDEFGKNIGKLSQRMVTPGNTWLKVWHEAQPVPISRQKRLFDDTIEALKILNYLETRTVKDIFELTILPLLHSAILQLEDIFDTSQVSEIFNEKIIELLNNLEAISTDNEISKENVFNTCIELSSLEDILKSIEALELNFYKYKCLEQNYSSCSEIKTKDMYKEILKNGFFCASFESKFIKKSEKLVRKEYVIRADLSKDIAQKEHIGPQFLRAIVTGEKIRLCGAFTDNTTFL